jgi:hypothetical protein
MIWWKTITLDLPVECFVGPAGDDARYPTTYIYGSTAEACILVCLFMLMTTQKLFSAWLSI